MGISKHYVAIDFKRRKFDAPATVERIEYDPGRTCFIALINHEDGEQAYIIAPQRLAVGDQVTYRPIRLDIKPGNAMHLERASRLVPSSTMWK